MIHDMIHNASYMAHGYCLLWKPWLVTLHAGSDLLTFLAYSAIPIAMMIFLAKRREVEFKGLLLLYVAFIFLCGLTHIFNLVTLWIPIYEAQGWVKAVTAAVSVATAITIFPLIPRAVALPSPTALKEANAGLAREIDAHKATLAELGLVRRELEERVEARTRELREALETFQSLFDRAPVAMLMADGSGRIRQANAAATDLFAYPPEELLGAPVEQLLPETRADAHQHMREAFQKAPSARRMGAGRDLLAKRRDGALIEVEIGLNPVRVEGETFTIASVVDVAERNEKTKQIRLLMAEVNHRAKNLLGVVQAIARQTVATSPREFLSKFGERLRALSANHDLLVQSEWRGVQLGDLVKAQLGHLADLVGSRIRVGGPSLSLNATAAQGIGMALHELATNATKYGALADDQGQIEIRWQVEDRQLVLRWIEQRGRPVERPERAGFGTTVITAMAQASVRGDVDLDFTANGVSWTLKCALETIEETRVPV